jgi:hypothetical protein
MLGYSYIKKETSVRYRNTRMASSFNYTFFSLSHDSLLFDTEKISLLFKCKNPIPQMFFTIYVDVYSHVLLTYSVDIVLLACSTRESSSVHACMSICHSTDILFISKSLFSKKHPRNRLQSLCYNCNTLSHTSKMRMIRRY